MSVGRICLGTAQLGMDYGVANRHGRPDDAACDQLLRFAMQHGVRCWDTAPVYGDAETRIGRFLENHSAPQAPLLVSKLRPLPTDIDDDLIATWVARELQSSLTRLRTRRLEVWLAHDPKSVLEPKGNVWRAMLDLQRQGIVTSIGVSVYRPEEALQALELPGIGAMQLVLNLFDTRVIRTGVLQRCAQQGIRVFSRSAFLQGIFALTDQQIPARLSFLRTPLNELRSELLPFNLSPMSAAIPFVLSQPEVDYLVLGVDSVEQLQENLVCAETAFPSGLGERIVEQFSTLADEHLEPRYWPS